jgi:hypothetical protein
VSLGVLRGTSRCSDEAQDHPGERQGGRRRRSCSSGVEHREVEANDGRYSLQLLPSLERERHQRIRQPGQQHAGGAAARSPKASDVALVTRNPCAAVTPQASTTSHGVRLHWPQPLLLLFGEGGGWLVGLPSGQAGRYGSTPRSRPGPTAAAGRLARPAGLLASALLSKSRRRTLPAKAAN